MRALEMTLALLLFSLLATLIQMTGALPYVNTAATSQWNATGVSGMVVTQNVSSNDMTGYTGYFTKGVNLLTTIGYILLGTLVVGVPICNMFGWTVLNIAIAGAIQTVIYVIIAYDYLYLWRGISWRSG